MSYGTLSPLGFFVDAMVLQTHYGWPVCYGLNYPLSGKHFLTAYVFKIKSLLVAFSM